MARINIHDPKLYLNRHLQWMAFNQRVLEEARDTRDPLLERVKFLAITANNLDEFVEIRVSSFLQNIEHGSQQISSDGLTSQEELELVSQAMHQFVKAQDQWRRRRIIACAGETSDSGAVGRPVESKSRAVCEDIL